MATISSNCCWTMQERIWCIFNMLGLQFMGPLKSCSQILVGTFSHKVILCKSFKIMTRRSKQQYVRVGILSNLKNTCMTTQRSVWTKAGE